MQSCITVYMSLPLMTAAVWRPKRWLVMSRIVIKGNVAIQCTIMQYDIILALMMFEHSQQVKHLGTSQTSSETVRNSFSIAAEDGCTSKTFSATADQYGNKGLS